MSVIMGPAAGRRPEMQFPGFLVIVEFRHDVLRYALRIAPQVSPFDQKNADLALVTENAALVVPPLMLPPTGG